MLQRVVCLRMVAMSALLFTQGGAWGQTTNAINSGTWSVAVNWDNGAPINSSFTPAINGFSMTLDGSYVVNALTMTNGSITGGANNFGLTMNSTSTWSGGSIGSGSTGSINFLGNLNINNASSVNLATPTMNLSGVTNWSGTGNIIASFPNATINNLSGGFFAASSPGTQTMQISNIGIFNNNVGATFQNSNSSANKVIQWQFNNAGTINVPFNNSSIDFQGGGNWGGQVTNSLNGSGSSISLSSGTFVLQNNGSTTNMPTNISTTVDIANSATYNFSGATVNLNSGSLASNGNAASILNLGSYLNWTAGNLGGNGTVNINFGGLISGNSSKSVTTANLKLNSFVSWSGNGNILATVPSAAITALSGSTFDIQNNATLQISNNGIYNNNAGAIFQKRVATGDTAVQWVFNNSGLVDVQSGSVTFSGDGNLGGTIKTSTSSSSTINFSSGTYTLLNGGSASGQFASGPVNVNGATLNLNNNATYNMSGGLGFSSGTLGGGGNGSSVLNIAGDMFTGFNWSGGSLGGLGTTRLTGVTNVIGSSSKSVATTNLLITNTGTFNWSGTGSILATTPNASITNAGVVNNTSDSTLQISNNGTFTNNGQFNRTIATGTTNIQWAFNNAGTVTVSSGILSFTGGGNLGGGLSTNTSGQIDFPSGTFNLVSGGSAQGNNLPGITYSGATLNINNGATYTTSNVVTLSSGSLGSGGDSSSILNVNSNFFTWSGGSLGGSGTTNLNALTTISGPSTKSVTTANLNNNGIVTWTGNSSILASTFGASINNNNNAVFDAQGDGTLQNSNTGTFNNNVGATFRKSAGAGTTNIQWNFNNNGIVEANSGTIVFSGTYTQGPTGNIVLGGGGVNLGGGSLAIQGGISGNGTVGGGGSISQGNGNVSPGASPGHLNINVSTFTMSSTSTLIIELAGTGQGTSYDWLSVTGAAVLGNAALNVSFLSGFQNIVSPSDVFTILTTGTGESGQFNGLVDGSRVFTSDGYGSFQINYSGNDVVLSNFQTIAVPEPATVALLLGSSGAGILWYVRRRRKHQLAMHEEIMQIDE
ncbi:MAG: PEP-CTERM sorting domain-containing protein [Gemmatales bacterium]